MPSSGLQTEWAFCLPDWLGVGWVFEFRNVPHLLYPRFLKQPWFHMESEGPFSPCPWSEIRRKCINRTVVSSGGPLLCHRASGVEREHGLRMRRESFPNARKGPPCSVDTASYICPISSRLAGTAPARTSVSYLDELFGRDYE